MRSKDLHFQPTPSGWEKARRWASEHAAPEESIYENLWEYLNSQNLSTYEIIGLVNLEFFKLTKKGC